MCIRDSTGRVDEDVLRGLSADATPALAALPADLAACATDPVRRDLAEPDGVAGFNLARSRARDALPPGLQCVYGF